MRTRPILTALAVTATALTGLLLPTAAGAATAPRPDVAQLQARAWANPAYLDLEAGNLADAAVVNGLNRGTSPFTLTALEAGARSVHAEAPGVVVTDIKDANHDGRDDDHKVDLAFAGNHICLTVLDADLNKRSYTTGTTTPGSCAGVANHDSSPLLHALEFADAYDRFQVHPAHPFYDEWQTGQAPYWIDGELMKGASIDPASVTDINHDGFDDDGQVTARLGNARMCVHLPALATGHARFTYGACVPGPVVAHADWMRGLSRPSDIAHAVGDDAQFGRAFHAGRYTVTGLRRAARYEVRSAGAGPRITVTGIRDANGDGFDDDNKITVTSPNARVVLQLPAHRGGHSKIVGGGYLTP